MLARSERQAPVIRYLWHAKNRTISAHNGAPILFLIATGQWECILGLGYGRRATPREALAWLRDHCHVCGGSWGNPGNPCCGAPDCHAICNHALHDDAMERRRAHWMEDP